MALYNSVLTSALSFAKSETSSSGMVSVLYLSSYPYY